MTLWGEGILLDMSNEPSPLRSSRTSKLLRDWLCPFCIKAAIQLMPWLHEQQGRDHIEASFLDEYVSRW